MNPRQKRLIKDYEDMVKLREQTNGMLDFRADRNYQHYVVTINKIETLAGTTEKNAIKQSRHVFTIDLSPEYPLKQPDVKFERTIFHPNWYPDGRVCYGYQWTPGDKLSELVIDTVKMMLFEIVDTKSPANRDANRWYLRNKGNVRNIIPKIQFPPPYSGSEPELMVEEEEEDEDGLEFY